jgi:hypothetical protein
MTRVFGSRPQPGAFFFLQPNVQNKQRAEESAMETATAVEIDKGRLRQLLLDDFHQLFGKAFANTAPAFPPLPQRRRRPSSLEEAITNKSPNTKFRLLPATDEPWKDQSGKKQQRTEWHNMIVWRKLADICGQCLTKGK